MTNQNEGGSPETGDDRARRIAEARARAEAARAARGGTTNPATGPQPAAAGPAPQPPAEQPQATTAPPEAPRVEPVAASAEDERTRRIAEARARAQAARGGGAAPAPQAAPPPAQPAAPPPAAAAAAAAGETPAEGGDDRAARIAAARARALAARGGTPAPAAAAPAATPEDAAARQARIEAARARTAEAGSVRPNAGVPAAPVAAAPAAPAARTAATAAARPMPAGPDEWRAPAGSSRVVTARPSAAAVAAAEMTREEVVNAVTRRSMLRTSFWASLGVVMAGFLLGFLNFFWPRKVVGFGGTVTVPAAQIPQPGTDPIHIFEAKAWVVNLKPGEGVPPEFTSFAQPSQKGGILALYHKCPHLGCTVPWRPEFEFEGVKAWFRCPCHGSTYTKAGVRVFGPAPRPMDTFLVTPKAGGIEINTGKITLGAPDNPQRTIQLT